MEASQLKIIPEAANIFIPIAETINTDFSNELYSKTIIEDVVRSLKEKRGIHVSEASVKDIVHNRQLILENLS